MGRHFGPRVPGSRPGASARAKALARIMNASRPVVMAPPRSTAPPRAFMATTYASKIASAGSTRAIAQRVGGRRRSETLGASLSQQRELRDAFGVLDAEGTPARREPGARCDREPARARGDPARPRRPRARSTSANERSDDGRVSIFS